MDELVNLVSQKVNIPPEQARVAVNTVLDFLKQKLPAPIAAQLDGVLTNPGQMGDIARGLGGIFKKG
jgi:hypothetical protein